MSKTATAEAPVEAPPEFRLLKRDVIVRSLPVTAPRMPVIRADVAWIGTRMFARWHAGPAWGYVELHPGVPLGHRPDPAHPADFDLTGGAVVVDPYGRVAEMIDQHGGPDEWLELSLESPGDRELKAFVGQWPTVAGMLGIDQVEPFRRFDPGRVRRPKWRPRDPAAYASVDWEPLLRDHVMGAWGELGRHSDEPLTAAQTFSLGMQPVELQSRAAVATGFGWVRSRFLLDPSIIPAKSTPAGPMVAAAEVVTALWRGVRSETLATITYVPDPSEADHG